jgi:hypothetical protein
VLEPPVPPAKQVGLDADWLVVVPAAGQLLFRLVGSGTSRPRDFQSDRDKERPQWPEQSYVDYLGVSMFETVELAEENAVRYPKMIASVRLAADKGFTIARTYVDIEGHYSAWGDPERFRASLEGVVICHEQSE